MIFSRSTAMPLRIVFGLALTTCLVLSFKSAYSRLRVPFEIDYEEGNVLNAGLRLVHGESPYPPPGSFPYIHNPYGPIGYVVSATGIRMFGLSLCGPRLLILLAGMGVIALIAILTRCLGGAWDAGAIVALSYLALPLTAYWLPLLRVDFVAILLSLVGLYLTIRFPSAWVLSGLIFGLAILTKQTAVAAPLAVVVELLLEKRLRKALVFLTVVCGSIAVCFLALGPNFTFAFLKTHPDPFSFVRVFRSGLSAVHACILVLAIIAYALVFGIRWTSQTRLGWLYLLFCSLSAFSAGKLGSNMNHFLEWSAAVCIVAGLCLSALLERNDLLARPLSLGLVVLAAIFSVLSLRNFGGVAPDQGGCIDAYAFVRSFPSQRIMSTDVSSLVLAGKPVLVSNPFVITQLGNSVDWQSGSVEQLTREQYFDLILLGGTVESFIPTSGGASPELMKAIGHKYTPYRYFRCPYSRVAYIPKPLNTQ